MAKRKEAGRQEAKGEEERGEIRTTLTGQRYKCLSIPGLLDKARASVPMPEVPRYSFETAGGDVMEAEIDDAVAADPKTSEEDRLRWMEYKIAETQAAAEQFAKIVDVCYKRGVELLDYDHDGDWVSEHRDWLELDVPDGRRERRMHFVVTEVVGCPQDVVDIVLNVSLASGVDKEAVAAAEVSFRRALGRAERDTAPDGAEEAGQVVGDG
jgi:hypothetical protein